MSAESPSLPAVLERVMRADFHRLRQEWLKLNRQTGNAASLTQWRERAERSAQQRAARSASTPRLEYDPELPITAHREELVGLLQSRQCLIVCGETGSGKSTQLPKFCLEAGLGAAGIVGHTQPRRLAARAVATRLADELANMELEEPNRRSRGLDRLFRCLSGPYQAKS